MIDVYLIGQPAANYDIETASAQDLVRVERFTFPIIFLVLVLVFRSVVGALVPLVLGVMHMCWGTGFLSSPARLHRGGKADTHVRSGEKTAEGAATVGGE